MTEIQGLEGLAQNVTEIDLDEPQPSETEGNEMKITLVTADGEEHDITEIVTHVENNFDGDDSNEDLNAERVTRLPGANGELFDPGTYTDVPVVDGQATDKLVAAFSGSLPFEASDKFAQGLFNRLHLGQSVTLQVEVMVMKKDGAYKVNAKDEETITGGLRLKVVSLYVTSPEDLA